MVRNQATCSGPNPATAPDPADSAKIRGAGRVFSRPWSLLPFPGPSRRCGSGPGPARPMPGGGARTRGAPGTCDFRNLSGSGQGDIPLGIGLNPTSGIRELRLNGSGAAVLENFGSPGAVTAGGAKRDVPYLSSRFTASRTVRMSFPEVSSASSAPLARSAWAVCPVLSSSAIPSARDFASVTSIAPRTLPSAA